MKILSIGNFTTGWDGSICDEVHIADALEELGHEVKRIQREELTLDIVFDDYDFTLVAQWDGFKSLIWLPKPIIYWAFDYQADGQEWHERLVRESDLYLSKRIADSKYPNWQWLSQDFAPAFLNKYPDHLTIARAQTADETYSQTEKRLVPDKDIDILFTGSYLPWATERNETLKAVDDKFNLVIHSINPQEWISRGFKDVRPAIMDDGLPELYARAKIILSIDHTLEAGYHSDRVAQILCCGGFVLHRYVPLDEVSFGDNIIYFYNPTDCLDKVQYYLNNEKQRENIAEKGYLFAQSNMKVINRVRELMIIVGALLSITK